MLSKDIVFRACLRAVWHHETGLLFQRFPHPYSQVSPSSLTVNLNHVVSHDYLMLGVHFLIQIIKFL